MAETNQARDKPEEVQHIPVSNIRPFPNHPFQVRDDELMQNTVDSIQKVGILTPVIVRPVPEGGYEMISGHRRMYAAELIGMKELPAIIRNMTDDEAVIFMVDSNLQREEVLPSERAKAYKMKLEALKHQGQRSDLTSTQVVSKFRSDEIVGAVNGDSRETVRRYIRLTELDPQLQQMVDEKKIGLTPAVEIS